MFDAAQLYMNFNYTALLYSISDKSELAMVVFLLQDVWKY